MIVMSLSCRYLLAKMCDSWVALVQVHSLSNHGIVSSEQKTDQGILAFISCCRGWSINLSVYSRLLFAAKKHPRCWLRFWALYIYTDAIFQFCKDVQGHPSISSNEFDSLVSDCPVSTNGEVVPDTWLSGAGQLTQPDKPFPYNHTKHMYFCSTK